MPAKKPSVIGYAVYDADEYILEFYKTKTSVLNLLKESFRTDTTTGEDFYSSERFNILEVLSNGTAKQKEFLINIKVEQSFIKNIEDISDE